MNDTQLALMPGCYDFVDNGWPDAFHVVANSAIDCCRKRSGLEWIEALHHHPTAVDTNLNGLV